MAKAFKRRAREELIFTPRSMIDSDKPLKFKFMTLSNLDIVKIDDKMATYDVYDQRLITASNEIDYQTAITYLTGWENLEIDGEEIPFNKEVLEEIDIVDELVELGRYIYIVSKYPDTKIEF